MALLPLRIKMAEKKLSSAGYYIYNTINTYFYILYVKYCNYKRSKTRDLE